MDPHLESAGGLGDDDGQSLPLRGECLPSCRVADIRADDVARHVHATGLTLRRHFRAALGRTVIEEITRLRLERAKRLLVDSDEKIKQVARDCGFTDAAYFDRVFVRVEGMSPGEYRRRKSSASGFWAQHPLRPNTRQASLSACGFQ